MALARGAFSFCLFFFLSFLVLVRITWCPSADAHLRLLLCAPCGRCSSVFGVRGDDTFNSYGICTLMVEGFIMLITELKVYTHSPITTVFLPLPPPPPFLENLTQMPWISPKPEDPGFFQRTVAWLNEGEKTARDTKPRHAKREGHTGGSRALNRKQAYLRWGQNIPCECAQRPLISFPLL